MKKVGGFIIFIFLPLFSIAQNISLNHTGTQFDGFENPVQQSFQKDLSRKYAVTLFPHINAFVYFKGDAESVFKKFLFTRILSGNAIGNLDQGKTNHLIFNANNYLANFKIFMGRDYNRELGFSLQLKDEGEAMVTNETFAILGNYRNFTKPVYINPFNSSGFNQSYWQLGVTYRENYNDKWGFGAKLSLLNGLIYNRANVYSSELTVNGNSTYDVKAKGTYTSSFGFNKLDFNYLLPNLKNIGAAVSLAAAYQTPSGYYFTANLKDAGFIRWGKKTANYTFDTTVSNLDPQAADVSKEFFDAVQKDANSTEIKKAFYSKINTKLEVAASKQFGFYKPVLVASKSVFNPQGQFALINNFRKNAFVFSLNAIYDRQSKFNLGSQLMVKSANMEFYAGSEELFPTYYLGKSYITKNENIGKGAPRANFYMGINVKFGEKVQSIGNAEFIPGLNDKETGYVYRLSKREKKRIHKTEKARDKAARKNNKRNRKR